jgi:REP element-mobilizing transposase RayT
LFGEIVDGKMALNEFGDIANECWRELPEHFGHIELDDYIIMPNHIHGIILITDDDNDRGTARRVPTGRAPTYDGKIPRRFGKPISGSLPIIIGSFKSAVTKHINELRNSPGAKLWQRNYWEHIIRNERDLNRIRKYIRNNPRKWSIDNENPDNVE